MSDLIGDKEIPNVYVFSALADQSLSIILQKNRAPVFIKQIVVQNYVSLSLQKYRVQNIACMRSSAPTSSVSVELRVLIFCFVEVTMVNPRPKYNPPPEFPHVLVWTANNVSTNHFKIPLPLALQISSSVRMPLIYLIMWTILAQSSRSGD